jgi:hypothetical protein
MFAGMPGADPHPLTRSFERHLRASNRSPRTVENYLASIRQLQVFLAPLGRELPGDDQARPRSVLRGPPWLLGPVRGRNGYDARRLHSAARPCDGCGRTVHTHSAWVARSCSATCQRGR